MKYFVCDRWRAMITQEYANNFLKECPWRKVHDTEAEAWNELHRGFYDDSDYTVCSIDSDGKVMVLRGRR